MFNKHDDSISVPAACITPKGITNCVHEYELSSNSRK